MEAKVYNASGSEVGKKALRAEVFGAPLNKAVLHETVRWQRSKKRAGTHAVKTRAEASGGGAKPWKQKGTGRARAGSNTSPLWVGGGIAHGPKPRSYEFSVNRKQRRAALCSALSTRQGEGRVLVVDFGLTEAKTKVAAKVLGSLGIKPAEKTLVVVNHGDAVLERSLRNLDQVRVVTPAGLNVYDVLNAKYVVMTEQSLEAAQQRLLGEKQ